MVKISRYILVITGIIVGAIMIPRLFWTIFEKVPSKPTVYYSCVLDDFITLQSGDKGTVRADSKGNVYTHDEYEKALPLMFFRQLLADGTMPDSINGVAMEPSGINHNNSFLRFTPRNMRAPVTPLWPMLESQSGRVNLEMPEDYFRIGKKGMEFIVADGNKKDVEKSELFTRALSEKGFEFPASIIAGIPTTRKSCDEGYFVTDNTGGLFHIKMIKGQPYVEKIYTPEGLGIVHIECVDLRNKEFYCYVFTRNNGIFVVLDETYDLQRIPLEGFNPYKHSLRITCDMFNKTLVQFMDDKVCAVAIDDMYNLVDSYEVEMTSKKEQSDARLFASLFPFEIKLKIPESKFVKFYFFPSPGKGWVISNILMVVVAVVVLVRKKRPVKDNILDLVLVALTGVFGLLAVLIFPNKFNRTSKE